MKRNQMLLVILSVAVLLISGLFIFPINDKPVKINACLKYDATCEMEKEYQVVKVLQNNPNIVNAYGKSLIEGEWYFYSKNARTLIPMGYSSGHLNPNDLEFADKGGYLPGLTGEVHSDTVELNLTGIGRANIIKLKMLLFGSCYAQCSFDGQKVNLRIAEAEIAKK